MTKKMRYILVLLLVSTFSITNYLIAEPTAEVVNATIAIPVGNQSDDYALGGIYNWIIQWVSIQPNQMDLKSDPDAAPRLYILDGGPGGGKTSIIQYLHEKHGYHYLKEAATCTYLERKTRGIEPPQEPLTEFHEEIIDLHNLRFEKVMRDARGAKKVFTDRSPIGIWGYKEANDFDEPSNLASTCEMIMNNPNICKTVFIVDLIPGDIDANNAARFDRDRAMIIHNAILKAYKELYGKYYVDDSGETKGRPDGFEVVIVPIDHNGSKTKEESIAERAEFILQYIREHNL